MPPQISDKFSTKDISVGEDGQAKFTCSASGHPTPNITWKKVPEERHIFIHRVIGDLKKGIVRQILTCSKCLFCKTLKQP